MKIMKNSDPAAKGDWHTVVMAVNGFLVGTFFTFMIIQAVQGKSPLGQYVPLGRGIFFIIFLLALLCLGKLCPKHLPPLTHAIVLFLTTAQILMIPIEIRRNPLPVLIEVSSEDGSSRKAFTRWRNTVSNNLESTPVLTWERDSRLLAVLDTVGLSMNGDSLKASIRTHRIRKTRPDSLTLRVKIRHKDGSFVNRASFRMVRPNYGESYPYEAQNGTFFIPVTANADTLSFIIGLPNGELPQLDVMIWQPVAYLEIE